MGDACLRLGNLPLQVVGLFCEPLVEGAELPVDLTQLLVPLAATEHALEVLQGPRIVLVLQAEDVDLCLELPPLQVQLPRLGVQGAEHVRPTLHIGVSQTEVVGVGLSQVDGQFVLAEDTL